MARYRYTQKNKKNKKSYYTTTIYNKVTEKNSDSYFIAVEGDRCDNLANRFYGDSRVNNLTTNNIPAGTSIRIPASTEDAEGL